MMTVFQAATAVEAHMIANLLQQHDIASARVEGEYLQGGVGMLQAIDVVRVVVDETDYEQALQIIADWEAAQKDDTAQADADANDRAAVSPAPAKTSLAANMSLILLGLLLGAGGMFLWHQTPITRDGIDYNGDGVLDVRLLYLGESLHRAEFDRNLDGVIDMIDHYNARGLAKSSRVDSDFNASFETIIRYHNDLVSRFESDTDGDGTVDLIGDYQHGELNRMTIRNAPGSAAVKRIHYQLGKMVCAEFDSNGDGVLETRIDYDFFEQPVSQHEAGVGCAGNDFN